MPVIKKIRADFPDFPLSIDTRNAKTAKCALDAGVDVINDVSACEWDVNMKNIAKDYDAPLILNHSKGTPENMQNNPVYDDISEEVFKYFAKKTDNLINFGMKKSKMIIDPGIGFGKTPEQNFKLLKSVRTLKALGMPVLVGHSRKSFLQKQISSNDNIELDKATNLVSAFLLSEGVNILRVHNVKDLKMLVELRKNLA